MPSRKSPAPKRGVWLRRHRGHGRVEADLERVVEQRILLRLVAEGDVQRNHEPADEVIEQVSVKDRALAVAVPRQAAAFTQCLAQLGAQGEYFGVGEVRVHAVEKLDDAQADRQRGEDRELDRSRGRGVLGVGQERHG